MSANQPSLTARELIVLGGRLTRIGVAALRAHGQLGQRGESSVPVGVFMVRADVFGHPATSIGEIADRTGLRQSYVSESVARLRGQGVLETGPDPNNGRRTLVRPADGHAHRLADSADAPVGAELAQALGETDPAALAEIIAALAGLASRLKPTQPGDAAGEETPRSVRDKDPAEPK